MVNEKIRIRGLELRGRIAMPPMATEKSKDGLITPEMIEYYAARAKNPELGLIITEHSYVDIRGKASPFQVSVASDDCVEGFAALADAVHREGARIFVQINHAGGRAREEVTGSEALSASAVQFNRGTPSEGRSETGSARALSADEILGLEELFVQAALRAEKAGCDGVEVHAAHGYLLNQFYSPLINRRDDEYGPQSVENRIRFACETVAKIRAAAGDDLAISVRLGGCDYAEGGSTIEDAAEASVLLEKAGADLIDITGGMNGYIIRGVDEPGWFAPMSAAVKKAVSVPVMVTGGVTTLAQAEKLLAEGSADIVGIARALLRDPVLR